MSLRFSPLEASALGALLAGIGAVGGWVSNVWKTRGEQRVAEDQLTIDREEAINQRVDGIFRAYDERIADLRREVGECRAEVEVLRRQMRENNELRDLAEIAANTARARADELYVMAQGLQAELTQCNERNARLLHQLAESAVTGGGHATETEVDRGATDSDP